LCILCGSTAWNSPLKKKAIDQPIFFFVVCFPLAVSVQGCSAGLPSFFGVRILHAGASLNAFGNA
jgi:hypothetical protein